MITLLFSTYIVFAAIVGITTALLLLKLSFAHAVLIIGFSVLAYAVRVWGTILLTQKKLEILTEFQKEVNLELAKKQAEASTPILNTKGIN